MPLVNERFEGYPELLERVRPAQLLGFTATPIAATACPCSTGPAGPSPELRLWDSKAGLFLEDGPKVEQRSSGGGDAELQKDSISELVQLWSQALAIEGRSSPDDDIRAIQQVTAEDVNRFTPSSARRRPAPCSRSPSPVTLPMSPRRAVWPSAI